MAATLTQSSTSRLAQAGTGTVRMCFPFPIKSATTQCSSRKILPFEPDKFSSPEPTADQQGQDGLIAICPERPLPAPCTTFFDCPTVSQLAIRTPRRLAPFTRRLGGHAGDDSGHAVQPDGRA